MKLISHCGWLLLASVMACAAEKPPLPGAFQSGLGGSIISAGRFGFLKGDGLLDCAYPRFGLIEKAHLCMAKIKELVG